MNTQDSNLPKIAPRKFQIGHIVKRIDRSAEGEFVGTVVGVDTDAHNKPHHRVDVRWANGSKSYRPEDELERAEKSELWTMPPAKLTEALATLGQAWGLDRPLHNSELARALRLGGRDPGRSVQDWLTGSTTITGPVQVAIRMMVAGAMPPDPLDTILRKRV